MGGDVGLTLREENGTEHRMCRFTNILPWVLKNLRLLDKNQQPAHVREILSNWYDMRRDYEENKKTGRFRHPMSGVYAPYPFLAPMDYGLVVVDLQEEQILSYQGYTSADEISGICVLNDLRAGETDNDSDAGRFMELYRAGRVTGGRIYRHEPESGKRTCREVSLEGKSPKQALALLKREQSLYFALDMSPFQVTEYRDGEPGEAEAMRERILELGFVLSNEEKQLWSEWIRERKRKLH